MNSTKTTPGSYSGMLHGEGFVPARKSSQSHSPTYTVTHFHRFACPNTLALIHSHPHTHTCTHMLIHIHPHSHSGIYIAYTFIATHTFPHTPHVHTYTSTHIQSHKWTHILIRHSLTYSLTHLQSHPYSLLAHACTSTQLIYEL